MARQHGTAGKALQRKLVVIVGILLGTGVLTAGMIAWLSPVLAPLAPILGLFVIAKLLQDREIQGDVVRFGRGWLGERTAGTVLADLPDGWHVFHDVDLGGENADHVVVSSRGVFCVEVKNYSGRISASRKGLYTHGKRNDAVVKQAWRQAHKLSAELGGQVQPVLAFNVSDMAPTNVGRLPVMAIGELKAWLLAHTERRLEYDRAREIFERLDARVRR